MTHMSPLIASAIVVAFFTGTGVGVLWREALEILLGKDDLVTLLNRVRLAGRTVLDHRTTISTWAVVLAFVVTIALCAAVLLSRHDYAKVNSRFQALVTCEATFNRLTAEARDDRIHAQTPANAAEIGNERADLGVWRGLRTRLTDTHGTLAEVLDVIDMRIDKGQHYLHALLHQQQVNAVHTYPPANYCTVAGGGLKVTQ